MANERTKTDCPFYGAKYCALLNMQSCDACMVAAMGQEEAAHMQRDLDVTMSLMPDQGVSELFMTEQCMLCKQEPGKREWYADVDVGNIEPKTTKSNFIGMKTIARTGSMVPLQISCCADCRKRILMIEYLPVATTLLISVLALVLMSIRPIRESLMRVHPIVPVVVFLAVVAAACFLGSALRKRLCVSAGKKTHLNVFDLPALSGMPARGWFEINEADKGVTHYVFAKKRMRQGIYTGDATFGDAQAPEA